MLHLQSAPPRRNGVESKHPPKVGGRKMSWTRRFWLRSVFLELMLLMPVMMRSSISRRNRMRKMMGMGRMMGLERMLRTGPL
jgi:hypothetical protein